MDAFCRYTNLAALIHILRSKKITLLDPSGWDDGNDVHFMAEYKRYINAKTVLALCFAQCPETYHHWHVFSGGQDGVCIRFNKHKILSAFRGSNIQKKDVRYIKLKKYQRECLSVEDLPFTKRYAYRDEKEFRVIYTNKNEYIKYKDYDFDIDCIDKITISPWMPEALTESIKDNLRSINECRELSIVRSTLIGNESWKELAADLKQ